MRHSKEEWKKLIKDFSESGLSQRKYCVIFDAYVSLMMSFHYDDGFA